MKILEIGPDSFPSTYQQLSKIFSLDWHTLDMLDNDLLTYPNSNEYSFDIPDNTYDVVLSGQVIEHVRKPWRWIPELERITKLGGLVITINPVSWIYHAAPIDCWRIYPEGMASIYEDSSLTILFSIWTSLETPGYRRYIPGISKEHRNRKLHFFYRIFGKLGFPVERSYDTITIGRKDRKEQYHQLCGM